ncbi:hypothetical protein NE686_00390 [Tissierella carlieri]|uniref:Rad52/22 family double-strand break repair protein n=2 Tax=Tissierella TaxID=41273 RepID=A0ABT1S4Y3_9FIRM|nr:hypothetical protein [Tissierella carlieri]MCQ4921526.1 hypothetical protein [Tissierella carlieri]
MNIRTLKADEIECRVQSVKENGFSLLLYKDARVDMAILDEVFGIYGWKRKHEVIGDRLYCTVSIYDKDTNQWIDKQDVGTESYTEKEKGQASDSFKRACFNVGIGRELYTAPFIWITPIDDMKDYKGKFSVSSSFKVKEIGYNDNREINQLVIIDNKGRERFRLGKSINTTIPTTTANTQSNHSAATTEDSMKCTGCGVDINQAVSAYSIKNFGKELCRDCQSKERK